MAVNAEEIYADWVKASDHLNEAVARIQLANKTGSDGLIAMARQDLKNAQDAYDEIAKKV